MKSDDTPMYDDPSESAFVRDLLQAGRRADAEYDVERGLAQHLATISAGSTAPYWLAGATAAKRAVPLWVGYVTVPLAAAGVAGLLWVFSARPDSDPATSHPPARDQASEPAAAIGVDPEIAQPSDEIPGPKDDELGRSGSDRRVARSSSRPSNSPAIARGSRGSATSRGPSEAPVVAIAEGSGSAPTRGGEGSDGVAANPYAGNSNAIGSTSSREPQLAESAVRNAAAPRSAEPVAEEPVAEEEEAARPAKQRAAANRPIVDESRLEREMQMLAVTQRVLASDPERALRLSEQGEREFPGTMFSAERRQLGLLALVKLGRVDEARREGRPFLARYPKAPWSERLRRALATGQVD